MAENTIDLGKEAEDEGPSASKKMGESEEPATSKSRERSHIQDQTRNLLSKLAPRRGRKKK